MGKIRYSHLERALDNIVTASEKAAEESLAKKGERYGGIREEDLYAQQTLADYMTGSGIIKLAFSARRIQSQEEQAGIMPDVKVKEVTDGIFAAWEKAYMAYLEQFKDNTSDKDSDSSLLRNGNTTAVLSLGSIVRKAVHDASFINRRSR